MESPSGEISRKSSSKSIKHSTDSKKKSSSSSKNSTSRRSDSSTSPPPTKRRHYSSDETNSRSDSDQEYHKNRSSHKSKSSRDNKSYSSSKKKTKQDDDKLHKSSSNNKSDEISSSNGGAGDMSLSIEETNKIRAKLGLKPLALDTEKSTNQSNSNDNDPNKKKTYIDKDTNQEFEHVPALNIGEVKEQKEFKQKLEEKREKRHLMEKLKTVKGIADESSDEDTELWVRKLKEKEEARKKEKLLEEMDQQFENSTSNIEKKSKKSYTSNHLKGLRVEHDQSYFKEGQEVILTLKDRAILKGNGENLDVDDDEEADVLVNVNIIDDERAAKNNENKKKKSDYNPYEDFDEDGNFREKSILDKYNEELEGEKKKSFRLGARGVYDASDDKFIEKMNQEHKARAIKLDILTDLKTANDFYTQQEIEAFKKPKKVRKVLRKNKMLKADDLLPLPSESIKVKNENLVKTEAIDDQPVISKSARNQKQHEPGETVSLKDIEEDIKNVRKNRNNRRMKVDEEEIQSESSISESDDDSIDLNKLKEANDFKEILEEENNALEELHSVLNKTRKRMIEPINLQIKQEADENEIQQNGVSFDKLNTLKEEPEEEENVLTLDTMTEFCRNLGNVPITSSNGDKVDDNDEDELLKEYSENKMNENSSDNEESNEENEEEMDTSTGSKSKKDEEDANGILDDEPLIDRGVASALKLAVNKGYLAKEKDKQNAKVGKTNIQAVNFTIEEKNYYDIDDKYNRGRDRYSGPLVDFEEKSNYKPDIKIDYIDEKGHHMNEKEAFRYLSHRFHGKGSGKKKTEKRIKKFQEIESMQKMSSVDTPLNTVALLVEKQKKLQQPFVVLSAQKGGKQDQVTLHKR